MNTKELLNFLNVCQIAKSRDVKLTVVNGSINANFVNEDNTVFVKSSLEIGDAHDCEFCVNVPIFVNFLQQFGDDVTIEIGSPTITINDSRLSVTFMKLKEEMIKSSKIPKVELVGFNQSIDITVEDVKKMLNISKLLDEFSMCFEIKDSLFNILVKNKSKLKIPVDGISFSMVRHFMDYVITDAMIKATSDVKMSIADNPEFPVLFQYNSGQTKVETYAVPFIPREEK